MEWSRVGADRMVQPPGIMDEPLVDGAKDCKVQCSTVFYSAILYIKYDKSELDLYYILNPRCLGCFIWIGDRVAPEFRSDPVPAILDVFLSIFMLNLFKSLLKYSYLSVPPCIVHFHLLLIIIFLYQ